MALDFGKLNFSVSFNPTSAFPLDARSYFESYESAVSAAATAMPAGDSNTVYYYGQTLCVVESNVATLYIIQPDKTLSKVGGAIEVDANQFLLTDEGQLSILGFADAVAGAQLVKSSDGKIQWVKPDTSTVEGLATEVESLRQDVTTIQGKLDNIYTKGETDSAIAAAVAGASHLKREIVESLPETSEADLNTIYMVPKTSGSGQNTYDEYMVLNGAWEILGNTDIDLTDYVTTDTLNTDLGKKANTADLGTMAGKNATDYVAKTEAPGYSDILTKTSAATTYATIAAVGNKVDKIEGKGLSTNDYTTAEKNKLGGIAAGAQVNVIESIKVNGQAQAIDSKGVNITVPTGALASKSKVAEADLETTLASKINGKANASDLADIATSGNVNDLIQTPGDLLILNCGSATANI